LLGNSVHCQIKGLNNKKGEMMDSKKTKTYTKKSNIK